MIRLMQFPLLGLIVYITWLHMKRFKANIQIDAWWHLRWGFAYGVPAAAISWWGHSWQLAVAFLIERFLFYDQILNLWRKEKFFYIVATNSKPGMWDKIKMWLGPTYPFVWGLFVIGYIAFQFNKIAHW